MSEEKVEKLSGEERVDALCILLQEKHGIVIPPEIYADAATDDDAGAAVDPDQYEEVK